MNNKEKLLFDKINVSLADMIGMASSNRKYRISWVLLRAALILRLQNRVSVALDEGICAKYE